MKNLKNILTEIVKIGGWVVALCQFMIDNFV